MTHVYIGIFCSFFIALPHAAKSMEEKKRKEITVERLTQLRKKRLAVEDNIELKKLEENPRAHYIATSINNETQQVQDGILTVLEQTQNNAKVKELTITLHTEYPEIQAAALAFLQAKKERSRNSLQMISAPTRAGTVASPDNLAGQIQKEQQLLARKQKEFQSLENKTKKQNDSCPVS